MPLVKYTRTTSRFEITKTQAESALSLAPVIEWTSDGDHLIAEHASVPGPPVPPLNRIDRKFTLITLDSIFNTLNVPQNLRPSIVVTFTSTHIVFVVNAELP
jgi:hypothetical protein